MRAVGSQKPTQICVQVLSVADIQHADKLVFPGVGAFEQAMGRLKSLGYEAALKEYVLSLIHI